MMGDVVDIIPPPVPAPTQQLVAPPGAAPPVGVPNHAFLMTDELINTTYTDKMVREEVDIHRKPNLMKKQPGMW